MTETDAVLILDEAGGARMPAPAAPRFATCLTVAERPDCHATVTQRQRPNGLWAPYWCPACLAAHPCSAHRAAA